jgi:hypothetical protein
MIAAFFATFGGYQSCANGGISVSIQQVLLLNDLLNVDPRSTSLQFFDQMPISTNECSRLDPT